MADPSTPEEPSGEPEAAAEDVAAEPEPSGEDTPRSEVGGGDEQTPASGVSPEDVSLAGLMDALRQAKVSELLLSTASTLASVAYGKLEASDLTEAKAAIDAIGVILPLLSGQLDAAVLRDFEQALSNLRLAYADAVSSRQ